MFAIFIRSAQTEHINQQHPLHCLAFTNAYARCRRNVIKYSFTSLQHYLTLHVHARGGFSHVTPRGVTSGKGGIFPPFFLLAEPPIVSISFVCPDAIDGMMMKIAKDVLRCTTHLSLPGIPVADRSLHAGSPTMANQINNLICRSGSTRPDHRSVRVVWKGFTPAGLPPGDLDDVEWLRHGQGKMANSNIISQ